MTRSLQDVTSPRAGAIDVDATWLQGRGAYGGLPIAAAVRAIEAHVADPRRTLRALTAELPAPTVPGLATVRVDTLRSGTNLTVARAALHQGDHVTAHVVATLAAPRDAGSDVAWCELTPPVLPAWQSMPPAPMSGPGLPAFAQHFDYRVATGVPFTGGATTTTGWVRARDPGPARDAAYVAAMIDVWYPAFLVRATAPRALATIAYTLELVGDLTGVDADAPLAYRGTVDVCHDGYFLETRELWRPDGGLVARNHQTFAIIR